MIRITILLLLSSFVLFSCGREAHNTRNVKELLKSNHFDLPDLKSFAAGGVRFQCSGLFEEMTNTELLLSKNGKVYWISAINVWLTVEKIDPANLLLNSGTTNSEEMMINVLELRKRSMTYHASSIFNHYNFSGNKITNVIVDGSDMYGKVMETYDIGLVERGKQYYLFQLYGSEKGISYLHDDFLDILKSIR